jgi:ADP-ribose pyrophosphatase YjhB (NUDIX family)
MVEPAQFCSRCGGPLSVRRLDDRERPVCGRCGFVAYRNPAPAAGVVVVEEGAVLLVQRKFEPRRGMWTMPAGFVEYDENVTECAIRETREEAGIDVRIDRLFGAYMAMDDPRTRVVLLLYRATRIGGELRPGDDAMDARFFPLRAVPVKVAFRAHEQALADLRLELGIDADA